jgi:drug/metabolite transporter (DMT)-like permease
MTAMSSPSRLGASLWMLGASAAFACMAAGVKLAAFHGVPLGQTLFYRGAVSLLVMYLYMRAVQVPFRTMHWKAHLHRGLASFVGMIAYFGGITLLPLAAAVTLNYTSPLLLGAYLLVRQGERPSMGVVLAMLGGFIGIVLLLRPGYDRSQWFGVLLALASALTAVIAALNIRSLGQLAEPPTRTVAHFSLYITLGALPWFLASHPMQIDLRGAAIVLSVGLFATLGQILLTLAYQRGHAMLVSLLGYTQVVFTSIIGIVLWGDRPGLGSWLAMALIIASGAVATAFTRRTSAAQ